MTVGVVGRVFVDYDPSLAAVETKDVSYASSTSGAGEEDVVAGASDVVVARVAVSGDSQELLNAIEVVAVSPDIDADGIKLRFKNEDFDGAGYLLTEVTVGARQALTSIATVQTDVEINIAGSGDIAVVAADAVVVGDSLSSSIGGSGDVFVQSAWFETTELETSIAGSGDVTYSRNGSCATQHVEVAGSGDVAAGSIVCVNSSVEIVGSGDVVVQTTEKLDVSTVFSGTVKYVNAPPKTIVTSSVVHFRKHHDTVSKAKKNKFDEYELEPVPSREATHVKLRLRESIFSDEPRRGGFWSWLIGSDDDSDGEDVTLSAQHHERRQYKPLLH
ncbi:hypothetical protein PINS_up022743 [Pythium insidiosum]|nr:hypothetical protein PINS_up022743 [Pythium insidiosum]